MALVKYAKDFPPEAEDSEESAFLRYSYTLIHSRVTTFRLQVEMPKRKARKKRRVKAMRQSMMKKKTTVAFLSHACIFTGRYTTFVLGVVERFAQSMERVYNRILHKEVRFHILARHCAEYWSHVQGAERLRCRRYDGPYAGFGFVRRHSIGGVASTQCSTRVSNETQEVEGDGDSQPVCQCRPSQVSTSFCIVFIPCVAVHASFVRFLPLGCTGYRPVLLQEDDDVAAKKKKVAFCCNVPNRMLIYTLVRPRKTD